MIDPIEIAAYYFGNYHVDPRNEAVHGPGWTEWELVRQARPRFPGHAQPRVPLWGYEDESDPAAAARKIDAAADHGLTAFIFDWYHYNDGLFLERALEQGFLRAPNNRRLKFALMWANHDWIDIHPAKARTPPRLLYPGAVTRATFDRIQDYCIATYFRHPSYWTLDGKPYFSIYELYKLVEGLGGVAATRDALERFRQACRAAGLPGLHLNAVVWGVQVLPGETAVRDPNDLLGRLGFDSVTSYVWVHHVPFRTFPTVPYDAVAAEAEAHWGRAAAEFTVPYFPNVTMGWDASPRTVQADVFENLGYPFMPVMADNTPAAFRRALRAARRFLESRRGDGDVPCNILLKNELRRNSHSTRPSGVNYDIMYCRRATCKYRPQFPRPCSRSSPPDRRLELRLPQGTALTAGVIAAKVTESEEVTEESVREAFRLLKSQFESGEKTLSLRAAQPAGFNLAAQLSEPALNRA